MSGADHQSQQEQVRLLQKSISAQQDSFVNASFQATQLACLTSQEKSNIETTSIQSSKETEQKASSDYLKEFREMIRKSDEYMKEWQLLNQIQYENDIKQIQEKARQERLQREERRRKRIARNTYSKQLSLFQNVKRFICIILNNNKENN